MNSIEQICDYFVQNKNTKFALQILKEISKNENTPEHLFVLGYCFYKLGEYDKAIKILQNIPHANLQPEICENIKFFLAAAYADKMETQKSIKILETCFQSSQVQDFYSHVLTRHKEIQQIQETGFWTDHSHHLHSSELALWLCDYLDKQNQIYDFGCGLGFYLKELQKSGFEKLVGFEGQIPENKFFNEIIQQDLTKSFVLNSKGNIVCLEVAEHIPKKYMNIFLENINKNCDSELIISWAVRGQMGIGHVNCLNNDEVINILKKYKFNFQDSATKSVRNVITDSCSWFKKSLLVFKRL